jgi:hypothetical protein
MLRREMKQLRECLAYPFSLPVEFRGARGAWRRNRLEAIVRQLETDPPFPMNDDPTSLIRVIEELRELWRWEKQLVRRWLTGGLEEWALRNSATMRCEGANMGRDS